MKLADTVLILINPSPSNVKEATGFLKWRITFSAVQNTSH